MYQQTQLVAVLDTCAILDMFKDATVEDIDRLIKTYDKDTSVSRGRISREKLERANLVLRADFLPSEIGRRVLNAIGLTRGGRSAVKFIIPEQVGVELLRVLKRQLSEGLSDAAALAAAEEKARRMARLMLSFLIGKTGGHVDGSSRSPEFVSEVERNCREAGRSDAGELFSWKKRNLGRVDESAIQLAVNYRDHGVVLITSDWRASERAYARGAVALTLNELCKEVTPKSARLCG